jgi:hypothetical protein
VTGPDASGDIVPHGTIYVTDDDGNFLRVRIPVGHQILRITAENGDEFFYLPGLHPPNHPVLCPDGIVRTFRDAWEYAGLDPLEVDFWPRLEAVPIREEDIPD